MFDLATCSAGREVSLRAHRQILQFVLPQSTCCWNRALDQQWKSAATTAAPFRPIPDLIRWNRLAQFLDKVETFSNPLVPLP